MLYCPRPEYRVSLLTLYLDICDAISGAYYDYLQIMRPDETSGKSEPYVYLKHGSTTRVVAPMREMDQRVLS